MYNNIIFITFYFKADSINISSSKFNNCTGNNYGGVLFSKNIKTIEISNSSEFKNN